MLAETQQKTRMNEQSERKNYASIIVGNILFFVSSIIM